MGFPKEMIDMTSEGFCAFLDQALQTNPLKCEYLIPEVVGDLLRNNRLRIKVLTVMTNGLE